MTNIPEAALRAAWTEALNNQKISVRIADVRAILAAAEPYIRADERAKINAAALAEYDAISEARP